MGGIFGLDSPLMRGLNKFADVMILNILVVIFAIPLLIEQLFLLGPILNGEAEFATTYVFYAWVFGIICCIPLGAALTAMHYVLLKVVRDEESYVIKTFFKACKENFKQASVLMMIMFFVGGLLVMDVLLLGLSNALYRYLIVAASILIYFAALYVFPLQSKFENKISRTIKNSFLFAIMALPRTVAMAVVTIIPLVLVYFFGLRVTPILFLFGFAGPGYLRAVLYNDTFKKFEPKEEALSEEQEIENAIKKVDEGMETESSGSKATSEETEN